MSRRWWRPGAMVVAGAGAVAATAAVPSLLGTRWSAIGGALWSLGLPGVAAVTGLWLAGLFCWSLVIRASWSGLSWRQAMAMNFAGSSAANVLPFGGVVGTGITLSMARSWELPMGAFASSTAVVNVVNVLGKLVLPVAAAGVVALHVGVGSSLVWTSLIAGGVAALAVLGLVGGLASLRLAVGLDRLWCRLRPRSDARTPVQNLRRDVRRTFRQRWRSLSLGSLAYLALQWSLFALCLHLTGVHGAGYAVFAAFATERAVTLAVITPAGAGLAEASAAGVLLALGVPAVPAAAGVLLYRLFVYGAEVPVGALVLAGWAWRRRVLRRRTA